MDEWVQSLITGAPNLAVALLVIYWQERRINRMEAHLRRLNEFLLRMPVDKEETD